VDEQGGAGSDPRGKAARLALVRLSGEIGTKAPMTRRHFAQRLVRNLKAALRAEGLRGRVERTHTRVFVELEDARGAEALARVFGAQSVALVESRPWRSLDDLVREGVSLFGEAVRGRRFAVRARRVGERSRIAVKSKELENALGAALAPAAAGVDLGNPEVTARIEVMPGLAYFFRENLPGRGGLPIGVEGRAVALVSGGFDSAVAAWQMLRRGVALDYVFCNLGGRAHQLGTMRVMKRIAERWSYGCSSNLFAIDFDAVSRDIQACGETRYWQILLKRLMLRSAEAVALERGAAAIVTGESVGQVSSQTLQNLAVISDATRVPILRPLVGMNKEEIIAIARDIGTYELSSQVDEYCAMVPRKPATHAALPIVQAEEQKLDAALLERALAEKSLLDLRALDLDRIDNPELEASGIPADATLIDLRSKAAYQGWHYPGALYLDFASALRAYPSFDAAARYVLYCEFGLKSAHLAELLRARGVDATHLKGGLEDALRLARRAGLATPEIP